MKYKIWDEGNCLGVYNQIDQALEDIRIILESNPEMRKTLFLLEEEPNGESKLITNQDLSRTPEQIREGIERAKKVIQKGPDAVARYINRGEDE